jgi:hypothetical protein
VQMFLCDLEVAPAVYSLEGLKVLNYQITRLLNFLHAITGNCSIFPSFSKGQGRPCK